MAAIPTVKLDARDLIDRLERMPEGVRQNLRRVLPSLVKELGNSVEQKLNTELKSRDRLKVDKQVREDRSGVYGVVSIRWTGDRSKDFIPQIIETGAKAHEIKAKNAPALAFLWPKVGPGMFFFKRVQHPGFAGILALDRSYKEMQSEILAAISDAGGGGFRETRNVLRSEY